MPKGLRLFPPGTAAPRRRRRLLFLAVWLVAALALVWPFYGFFAGTFPLVFGLPLSLAWPVGWLFVMLGALLWLFRHEPTA